MGEVVRLEKPSPKDRKTVGKPKRRRPRRSRTALVLGGGGFTGGVYEIGALRALDLLAVNRTVNQFDVYVGTSAGSFVAALTANGVTPEEMMRVVNQQVPTPFKDVDRSTLMRPNALEFAQSMALMPLKMLGLARNLVGQFRSTSLIDLAVGVAEALPSGLYDGKGIEEYLRSVLGDPDRVNDFRLLERERQVHHAHRPELARHLAGEPRGAERHQRALLGPVDEVGPQQRPEVDVAERGRHLLVDDAHHLLGRDAVGGQRRDERAGGRADVDVELVHGAVDAQEVERAQRPDLVHAAREAAAPEHQGGLGPLPSPFGRVWRPIPPARLQLDDVSHVD